MAAASSAPVQHSTASLPAAQPALAGEKKNHSLSSSIPAPVPAQNINKPEPQVAAPPAPASSAPINNMPAPAPEYQTPEPAPVVVQPSTQPQQQSQPGSNRRISKNILGGLEDAINNAASTQVEKIELTYDKVIEVFEQYKTKLRAENKSVYHAQFSSMQVEMIPPEEVRFIVNDDLVDAYAKDKRDELYKAHFYMQPFVSGIFVLQLTIVYNIQ